MKSFISNLAKGAGAILRKGFRKKFKVSTKSASWDYVTEYDIASERFIMDKIKKRFPNHGFYAEETGQYGSKKNFWVIDPLDGTHAFARGIAQFSVSIAFVSNGQIQLGAVYDPAGDELFMAEKGKGASLNSKKIKVSSHTEIINAMTAMTLGLARTSKKERIEFTKKFRTVVPWQTQQESIALSCSFVACGRYDMVISKNLFPWDYSAGALLLSEAGAKVTDFRNKPFRWDTDTLVAANPILHKKVFKIINTLKHQ